MFTQGFVASEVPVKPHFHNKGLSLTALLVLPFWNHLAFRLSFPFNLFCQRREALTHVISTGAGGISKQKKNKAEKKNTKQDS